MPCESLDFIFKTRNRYFFYSSFFESWIFKVTFLVISTLFALAKQVAILFKEHCNVPILWFFFSFLCYTGKTKRSLKLIDPQY